MVPSGWMRATAWFDKIVGNNRAGAPVWTPEGRAEGRAPWMGRAFRLRAPYFEKTPLVFMAAGFFYAQPSKKS